jgi:hypothetical protein
MATPSQWTREHHPGAKPGRRKGSKNKIPRSVKALILGICEQIVTENPELIRRALVAGLTAKPPRSCPYLQLAVYYLDGTAAIGICLLGHRPMQDGIAIAPSSRTIRPSRTRMQVHGRAMSEV